MLKAPLVAGMLCPFHNGHQEKQGRNCAQGQAQCDIAFAAFLGPLLLVLHRWKAGSPITFSAIRAANNAVMYRSETPNSRWAAGSFASFFSKKVRMASTRNQPPMPALAAR